MPLSGNAMKGVRRRIVAATDRSDVNCSESPGDSIPRGRRPLLTDTSTHFFASTEQIPCRAHFRPENSGLGHPGHVRAACPNARTNSCVCQQLEPEWNF